MEVTATGKIAAMKAGGIHVCEDIGTLGSCVQRFLNKKYKREMDNFYKINALLLSGIFYLITTRIDIIKGKLLDNQWLGKEDKWNYSSKF